MAPKGGVWLVCVDRGAAWALADIESSGSSGRAERGRAFFSTRPCPSSLSSPVPRARAAGIPSCRRCRDRLDKRAHSLCARLYRKLFWACALPEASASGSRVRDGRLSQPAPLLVFSLSRSHLLRPTSRRRSPSLHIHSGAHARANKTGHRGQGKAFTRSSHALQRHTVPASSLTPSSPLDNTPPHPTFHKDKRAKLTGWRSAFKAARLTRSLCASTGCKKEGAGACVYAGGKRKEVGERLGPLHPSTPPATHTHEGSGGGGGLQSTHKLAPKKRKGVHRRGMGGGGGGGARERKQGLWAEMGQKKKRGRARARGPAPARAHPPLLPLLLSPPSDPRTQASLPPPPSPVFFVCSVVAHTGGESAITPACAPSSRCRRSAPRPPCATWRTR